MKDMESTKSSLDKARQRFEDQREKLNKDTGSGRLAGRTNLNALQLSETDYPIIRGFKSLISQTVISFCFFRTIIMSLRRLHPF